MILTHGSDHSICIDRDSGSTLHDDGDTMAAVSTLGWVLGDLSYSQVILSPVSGLLDCSDDLLGGETLVSCLLDQVIGDSHGAEWDSAGSCCLHVMSLHLQAHGV